MNPSFETLRRRSVPLRANALLVAACLSAGGCGGARAVERAPLLGDHEQTVEHEGPRSYLLHVPASYSPRRAWPLLVVLHGAYSDGEATEKLTTFGEIADRQGFVVAYPNATARPAGTLQLWNAGHCCGKQVVDHVDDLGFVGAVLDDVERKVKIDPRRVYVAGYSNGGMLTFLVASRYAGRLAAVGIVSGNMSGRGSLEAPEFDAPAPARPVSVVMIQGTEDTHVPYKGEVHKDSVEVPFDVTGLHWAKADCCVGEAAEKTLFEGAVGERRFGPCADGTEVRLLSIHGWKHEWPGEERMKRLAPDDPLRGFDAAELLWAFFAEHPRGRAPSDSTKR